MRWCCGLSLAGAATSIILVAAILVATKRLSRQIFLATNIILQNTSFVATEVYLSQQNGCRNKHVFVTTKIRGDKSFVTTSILLSRQKTCFVVTNTCLSRQTTKHLSRQKLYLWQLLPMIVAMHNLSVQGSHGRILWTQKWRFPVLRTQSWQVGSRSQSFMPPFHTYSVLHHTTLHHCTLNATKTFHITTVHITQHPVPHHTKTLTTYHTRYCRIHRHILRHTTTFHQSTPHHISLHTPFHITSLTIPHHHIPHHIPCHATLFHAIRPHFTSHSMPRHYSTCQTTTFHITFKASSHITCHTIAFHTTFHATLPHSTLCHPSTSQHQIHISIIPRPTTTLRIPQHTTTCHIAHNFTAHHHRLHHKPFRTVRSHFMSHNIST